LRSVYETSKILQHFAGIDHRAFGEIFGGEPAGVDMSDAPVLRVAEIARRCASTAHGIFALDCLHAHADSTENSRRLRDWAGSMDVFNVLAVQDLEGTLQERDNTIAGLRNEARNHCQTIEALNETIQKHDSTIAHLNGILRERDQIIADLRRETGERDRRIESLSQQSATLTGEIWERTRAIERLATELRDAEAGAAELQASIAELEQNLERVLASRQAMLNSLSWRSTAFVRAIERTLARMG